MGDIKYSRKEFVSRVGTFFMLIGIGMMILFLFSDSQNKPEINYFCSGFVLIIVAILFRRQYKKPVVSSGRFTGFPKLMRRIFSRGGGGGKKQAPPPEDDAFDEE